MERTTPFLHIQFGNVNTWGCYSICVNDVRGTEAPSPAVYGDALAQWGHVDLQIDANGPSFVSNNNIFTILFLTLTVPVE